MLHKPNFYDCWDVYHFIYPTLVPSLNASKSFVPTSKYRKSQSEKTSILQKEKNKQKFLS